MNILLSVTAPPPQPPVLFQPWPGFQTRALQSSADECLWAGAKGPGKGLDLQTPLPTPTGWTTMGDVVVGDTLFDEQGNPCHVTHVHELNHRPCFRVIFDDGTIIVADDVHQWSVLGQAARANQERLNPEFREQRRKKRMRRAIGGEKFRWLVERNEAMAVAKRASLPRATPWTGAEIRSTAQLAEYLETHPHTKHAIPCAKALVLAPVELLIDPYVLGAWIGDGTARSAGLTCDDRWPWVVESIRERGYEVWKHKRKFGYWIKGLISPLRALGVLGKKRIPVSYLRSSIGQRRELLAGLMDTDGSVDVDGQSTITTSKPELASDYLELIQSLGYKPGLASRLTKCQTGAVCASFRISWMGFDSPVTDPKKAMRLRDRTNIRARRRFIVSVEPTESRPTRCISVDSPSRLYLASTGMVPTHNSTLLVAKPLYQTHKPNYKALVLRETYGELQEMLDRMHRMYLRLPADQRPVWHGDNERRRWEFPSGAKIKLGYYRRKEDVSHYQGQEWSDILFDEIGNLADEGALETLLAELRSPDPTIRRQFVCTANPGGRGHCLPPESDVLTESGWRPIASVVVGDRVATLDENENFVYRRVEQVHARSYEGPLFEYRSVTATVRCTPNHNLCRRTETKTRRGRTFHPISQIAAEDISGVTRLVRAGKGWEGDVLGQVTLLRDPASNNHYRVSQKQPLTLSGLDYAELCGWVASEGHTLTRRGTRKCFEFGITQTKAQHRDRIRTFLTRCGFLFQETAKSFIVPSIEWTKHLREVCGHRCREKRVPPRILRADAATLRRFWEVAMLGDGDQTGVYHTISVDLANQMVEVGLKLGYSPALKWRQRADRVGPRYEIRFRRGRDVNLERSGVKQVSYQGMVYCLGIPELHRFFVRQAGTVWLSGNSWLRRRFVNLCGKQGERIVYVKRLLPNGQVEMVTRQFVPGRVTDNPIYANDPKYMARLMSLPDRLRRCLLEGDWDAATGAAFDELDPDMHLVKPFECPSHWPYVAAFDWGYSHWAVFGWGRVSEDGRVYVNDTLRWRHFQDWDLVEAIKEMVPHQALRSVQAGHDLWHELRANRGDGTPTRAEYYQSKGIGVTQANIMRAAGYANMMQYMAHRETPYIQKRLPAIRFFDTPGNRWLVEEHLPSIVVNPDNPSDVLKVDADPETGEGGDDGYDMIRMMLARRPFRAPSKLPIALTASSDYVLRREAEKVYRPDLTEPDPNRPHPRLPGQLATPYLGA